MDRYIRYPEDTIFKDGINVSDITDILWCIPTRDYFFKFSRTLEKNDSAIQDIMLDSLIWYNLIDRVLSSNGDNWYHTQQDPASYVDFRLFNTLVTLIVLGLKQVEFHYKKDINGIWYAPACMTYGHFIGRLLWLLKCSICNGTLASQVMDKNKKNFRATYGLSTKGAGVHTIKSYQNKSNKTNTTTMNYIHSDEAVLQKYKDNGSYDIIASDLSSRDAAYRIKKELGINISHVTVQKCRNRIARLQTKQNSEESCLNQ